MSDPCDSVDGWGRKLRWSDFSKRSNRPAGSTDAAAGISPEIRYDWQWTSGGGEACVSTLSVSVDVGKGPNDTWVLRGKESDELLRHEQLHYDLAALAACRLYRELDGLCASQGSQLESKIPAIYRRMKREWDRLDDRYDRETDHGKKDGPQKRWEEKVRRAKRQGKPDQVF